jgi:hypothetical protein
MRMRWLLVPIVWVLALLAFDASEQLPSVRNVYNFVTAVPVERNVAREAAAILAVKYYVQPYLTASQALLAACTGNQASPAVLYGAPEDGVHCQAVDNLAGHPGYQRWVLVLPEPAERREDCYWLTKSCEPRDIRRAETTSGVVATASPSAEKEAPPVLAFAEPGF